MEKIPHPRDVKKNQNEYVKYQERKENIIRIFSLAFSCYACWLLYTQLNIHVYLNSIHFKESEKGATY